jgi:hypothetical protein
MMEMIRACWLSMQPLLIRLLEITANRQNKNEPYSIEKKFPIGFSSFQGKRQECMFIFARVKGKQNFGFNRSWS